MRNRLRAEHQGAMTGPARRPSPRALVQRELSTSDRFRTVNEVYLALAGQGPGASLSTVYRTLTALVDARLAETVYLPSTGNAYRLRPQGATVPYLVCVRCGTATPAPTIDLAPWFGAVATEQGFTDVEVRIRLWGRCKSCQRNVNENDSQF